MSSTFLGKLAEDWLTAKWRSSLSSELGLKTCQSGSLHDFPAIKTLSTHLPGVFTMCTRAQLTLQTVNAGTWLDVYYFRVVFIAAMIEDGTHQDANRFKIERFADVARDNHAAADLAGAPSGTQQIHVDPVEIEYHPPEDGLEAGANIRANAMALTIKMTVLSNIQ